MVPMGSAAQVNGEVRVDLVDLVAADHLTRRSGAVDGAGDPGVSERPFVGRQLGTVLCPEKAGQTSRESERTPGLARGHDVAAQPRSGPKQCLLVPYPDKTR